MLVCDTSKAPEMNTMKRKESKCFCMYLEARTKTLTLDHAKRETKSRMKFWFFSFRFCGHLNGLFRQMFLGSVNRRSCWNKKKDCPLNSIDNRCSSEVCDSWWRSIHNRHHRLLNKFLQFFVFFNRQHNDKNQKWKLEKKKQNPFCKWFGVFLETDRRKIWDFQNSHSRDNLPTFETHHDWIC